MTISIERIVIGEDGTLKLPKETLEALGTREVRLDITPARPFRIDEIKDPEERLKAFDAFVKRVSRPSGVTWPEGYDVRDDVYD